MVTKKQFLKLIRGMPDDAQIVIHDADTRWFLPVKMVALENKARVKKIIVGSDGYCSIIGGDVLLTKAANKPVYFADENDRNTIKK